MGQKINNYDEFNLNRFVKAQQSTFDKALAEIKCGLKSSHWMWFVFPQIAGLGSSELSRRFAIEDLDEAQAYLSHPLLGKRLVLVSETLLNLTGYSACQIFGQPDDAKLWSCMTLFAHISNENSVFHQVLDKYFEGKTEHKTLALI